MEYIDKIVDHNRYVILNQLMVSRSFAKWYHPDNDFYELILISEVEVDLPQPYLKIEFPEGDYQERAQFKNELLEIEFQGLDHLPHRFETKIIRFNDDHVLLEIPEKILRIQKRENFRIKCPEGSTLQFVYGSEKFEFNLINISFGGLFCFGDTHPSKTKIPKLSKGERLAGVTITLPVNYKRHHIKIKETAMVRFHSGQNSENIGYAFRFISINSNEKNRLKKVIYEIQRLFLERRVRV